MPVITEDDWNAYEEVLSVLKIPYEATVQMQAVQFTLSDFYAVWADTKLKLKAFNNVEMACDIVRGMEKKEVERHILDSPPILSCVFLDSRYRDLLNDDQISIAVRHLTGLWHKHQQINHNNDTRANNTAETISEENAPKITCLRDLLEAKQKDRTQNSRLFCVNDENALRRVKIMPYNNNLKLSTIKFWSRYSLAEPQLYELACFVNAAAPTETRIEGAFSSLAFILNPHRTRLSNQSIDTILIVRLNKSLLDDINLKNNTRMAMST